MDHVLLNCRFSKKIWEHFLPTFKKPWAIPSSAKAGLGQDLIQGTLSPGANWLRKRLAKAIMQILWKRVAWEYSREKRENFII